MSRLSKVEGNPVQRAMAEAGLERISRLAHVPDLGMRRAVFIEEWASLGDLAALWAVEVLVREVLCGSSEAQRVYDALYSPQVALSLVGLERESSLRELAIEEKTHGAYHWLFSAEASGHELGGVYEGRPLDRPLGVRRSDARKASGTELEKLLHDSDPTVIGHLLNAPQITESFVLKLCSKRPVSAESLVMVTESQKWFSRYSVKRALILNPYLPGPHAHNLLVYLRPNDLADFSREPTVAGGLRASAARLYRGFESLLLESE